MRLLYSKNDRINRWLAQARWAPSGGNEQPWIVYGEERGQEIVLELKLREDYSSKPLPMDPHGCIGFFALGGLAHNLEICAKTEGYSAAQISLSETGSPFTEKIILRFTRISEQPAADLTGFFQARKTDRSMYSQTAIPEASIHKVFQILESVSASGGQTLSAKKWTSERKQLVKHLLPLEMMRWQNQAFTSETLHEISFRNDLSTGIPGNTLKTSPAKLLAIRLLKRFPRLAFLTKWGASQIAKDNLIRPLAASAAVLMIQAQENSTAAWFQLGRAYQEIWLYLTEQGISLQPISMTLIGYNHLQSSNDPIISASEAQRIQRLTATLQTDLGLDLKKPMLGFRIGYSKAKTELSPRRPLLRHRLQSLVHKSFRAQARAS